MPNQGGPSDWQCSVQHIAITAKYLFHMITLQQTFQNEVQILFAIVKLFQSN